MNISLPKQVEDYIKQQIRAGAFPSPDALIESAIRTQQLLQAVNSGAEQQQRRKEAIRLHEIEGNPFTPEDEVMFAMFDRKGLSFDERAEYIKQQALNASVTL